LHPPATQDKASLSDEDVAASGISLIIAGNDTSGLGITALLGLLPLLPAVMERLRQEQQQVGPVEGSWGNAYRTLLACSS
jgi:cytochrome P450